MVASWKTGAPMGVPRVDVGGAALGDRVYAVGGADARLSAFQPGASAVVEAYDTVADQWDVVAPLPMPLRGVAAAAVGGILYAVGGLAADGTAVADVFAYDPTADTWTPRAPLPAPRAGAAALAFGQKVYVAGGKRDGDAVHDFAVYDPASGAWTVLPLLPHAREGLGLAATDILIYAMGGRDGDTALAIGEAFYPPSNQWFKEVSPLIRARSGLAMTGLGGQLYAFGGYVDGPEDVVFVGPPAVFPDVETFDPTRNSWFPQPDLPTPRAGLAAVSVGSRIYVVGGATGRAFNEAHAPTGATEIFLPASTDPLTVKKLALPRRGTRLRLVASLRTGPEDPAAVQLRVQVREGNTDVAAVSLGTGALVAKRRGWLAARDALPARSALSLRRRRDSLVLRLAAQPLIRPTTRHGLGVVVELGARILSGAVR